MKVLLINGSPHAKGNTAAALEEMKKIFDGEGIGTEILHIGNKDIRGCIACGSCGDKGKCVFDDEVNAAASKFEASWWEAPCITRQPTPRLSPFWTACSTAPTLTRP